MHELTNTKRIRLHDHLHVDLLGATTVVVGIGTGSTVLRAVHADGRAEAVVERVVVVVDLVRRVRVGGQRRVGRSSHTATAVLLLHLLLLELFVALLLGVLVLLQGYVAFQFDAIMLQ